MLGWFRALLPKEDRFFGLFEQHAALVLAGAKALRLAVDGGVTERSYLQTVSDREVEADDVTREVMLAVRRSFITPFDRSAIITLITALDDSVDQMQKTCKTITLFKMTEFEPEMRAMADCIVQAATVVAEAVPLLRSVGTNAGRISELAQRLSEIEGRTDDLYDAARSRLYDAKGPSQPIDFWVASELLSHLEKVVDRLEDVADEISGIAIENV
jgi:predicted phosphate transport protein (TIGR00153 family)